ncbi:hypothetical protein KIN20_025723 [Parelaphostrongylus tenuis]|uniref:Uncharacterized protein n=1 Tax=Parelaphostrongylus tenuis TaxID=148309 RepID=A0AAD5NDG5_PARTN|nr:hypothetical protein KIN20_025723 [Parelaphostrongylus tenuis]
MKASLSGDLPGNVKEMLARTRKNAISLFLEIVTPEVVFENLPGDDKGTYLFVTSVQIEDLLLKGSPHRTKSVSKLDCFIKGIKILCKKFSVETTNAAQDLQFKQDTSFFELLRLHTYAKFYRRHAESSWT